LARVMGVEVLCSATFVPARRRRLTKSILLAV
jgi:hypothetical protein